MSPRWGWQRKCQELASRYPILSLLRKKSLLVPSEPTKGGKAHHGMISDTRSQSQRTTEGSEYLRHLGGPCRLAQLNAALWLANLGCPDLIFLQESEKLDVKVEAGFAHCFYK